MKDPYEERIKQNDNTGRWHIDGGLKGYNSYQTAHNALTNYEKRVKQGIDDAVQLQKDIRS